LANVIIPQKTLRIGVTEPLYVSSGGAFNTTGTCGTAPDGTFGIPPQCSVYRGRLVLQGVPIGGTVTTAVFKLETSLDGGVTFATWNNDFGVTNAAATFTSYLTLTLTGTGTTSLVSLDISGGGGLGCFRLNATTLTLGTGSGFNVYAHLG
jgi:hypothetical protein